MADARRERIAVAVMAALTAGCAPIVVERNRRTAVDASEAPAIVVYDLGHQAAAVDVGSINYVMQFDAEGTVSGSDDTLGTAVNALYVSMLAALRDYTLGGLCIGLQETALDVRIAPEAQSSEPLATFTLSFEVTFETPDGDPTG